MNKIILSFDYEIYFDGGNNYEALLESTDKIISISKVHHAKLVFFVDVLYFVKLEENGLNKALSTLKNQINGLIQNGHEIQFHYHPHWINAKYNQSENKWIFDKTEYSYADILKKYGSQIAESHFNNAYKKFVEYFGIQSNTYRAGGLSINESQSELIKVLLLNNFKFDSSVMPGLKITGNYLNLDHTKVPSTNTWNISSSSGFFATESGNESVLTEIPIMSINKNRIGMIKRAYTSFKYRILGISSSKSGKESGKPFDLEIKETIYPTSITFDKSTSADIVLLKHFTNEYFDFKNQIMCILSHPKSYLDQSYSVFSKYLKWLNKNKQSYSIIGFSDLS